MPYTALNPQSHLKCSFDVAAGIRSAAQLPVIPALLPELADLSAQFTLGFVKSGDLFQLVVLLGSPELGSVYIQDNGQWLHRYCPASLKARPFALLPDANKPEELLLCIDEEALLENNNSMRLFNDDGQLEKVVLDQLEFLKKLESAKQATQAAVKSLYEAGVIKEWELTLESHEKPSKTRGFYCIDQQRLNELSAETYHSLQGAPMIVAYAQAFSMRNVPEFNARLKAKDQRQTENVDLESLFDSGEHELLKF